MEDYVWDYEISCHEDLDEEYARDSYDYTELAYIHYA